MRKKRIEKVPYLGLCKTKRDKRTEFVAVTSIQTFGEEDHLFVEIYKNDKKHSTIPEVRIVLTKKDYGLYDVAAGAWYETDIKDYYCNYMYWENNTGYRTNEEAERANAIATKEDYKRIEKWVGKSYLDGRRWFALLENEIREVKRQKRYEAQERNWKRRQNALADREQNIKPVDKKELLDWTDKRIFGREHKLYYKKKGVKASVCCSSCGGVYESRWKRNDTYMGQYEHCIEEPKAHEMGTCDLCGDRGEYIAQGRAKLRDGIHTHIAIGQQYKENGFVLRFYKIEKEWFLEQIPDGKGGYLMHGSYEQLSGIEMERAFFQEGQKTQVDYHKSNVYSGDFWDDCDLAGNAHMKIYDSLLHPDTFGEIENTFLKYSALYEYSDKGQSFVNPIQYLNLYAKYPQMEFIMKMNLFKLVKKMEWDADRIVKDATATRIDEFLGIKKQRTRLLCDSYGDTNLLKVLQTEKETGLTFTDAQIRALKVINIHSDRLEKIKPYLSLQKALNYIEKYAGCYFDAECSKAMGVLRHTATTYFDYLDMREELGYNMHNTVYLHPRNLQEEHDKMLREREDRGLDRRSVEVRRDFPEIAKQYEELELTYGWKMDDMFIRPAKDAAEIVKEGRELHHCVGGNGYLSKHNKGQTFILFLRYEDKPDMPFVTVEIERFKIVQWYGAHDTKPEKEKIEEWLQKYVDSLKEAEINKYQMMA